MNPILAMLVEHLLNALEEEIQSIEPEAEKIIQEEIEKLIGKLEAYLGSKGE